MGRTALMLSGGGLFGSYHFGLLRILFNNNLLPRIISGSSAGSIAASVICCQNQEELHKVI